MKACKTENVNGCFHNYQSGAENLKVKNTIRLNKGRIFFRIPEDWWQDKLASDRGEGTVKSTPAQCYDR